MSCNSTSRTSHTISKIQCASLNCTSSPNAFSGDGDVNTNYNIYKGLTSNSCIFPTPGDAGSAYDFGSYYVSSGQPDSIDFSTGSLNPVATELLVTPSDLATAVVFLFTSFTVTDLD